jgi:hypothetical protein
MRTARPGRLDVDAELGQRPVAGGCEIVRRAGVLAAGANEPAVEDEVVEDVDPGQTGEMVVARPGVAKRQISGDDRRSRGATPGERKAGGILKRREQRPGPRLDLIDPGAPRGAERHEPAVSKDCQVGRDPRLRELEPIRQVVDGRTLGTGLPKRIEQP